MVSRMSFLTLGDQGLCTWGGLIRDRSILDITSIFSTEFLEFGGFWVLSLEVTWGLFPATIQIL